MIMTLEIEKEIGALRRLSRQELEIIKDSSLAGGNIRKWELVKMILEGDLEEEGKHITS